jgi:hypothetical protein
LNSICIPAKVKFIDGSAFLDCQCELVTVNSNNLRFVIDNYFLVNVVENCLVRYFGEWRSLTIPSSISVLGSCCFGELFENANHIEELRFESGSRVTRIEEFCFGHCGVKEICIPRSVQMLCSLCFACDEGETSIIATLIFETNSQLIEIEPSCFLHCSITESIDIRADLHSVDAALRLDHLIEKGFLGVKVGLSFDIASGDIAIPAELKNFIERGLHFYTYAQSLTIPDRIKFIDRMDFHSCGSLRRVFAGSNN